MSEKREKRSKKPTLEQKKRIAAAGLKWESWLVKEEDNISLTVKSKKSGQIRVIFK